MLEERRHSLTMDNYLLIHRWSPEDDPYILYTEKEPRTVYRTFGHPSVWALQINLGRAANACKVDRTIANELKKIKDDCQIYWKTPSAPRTVKFTVGRAELWFNHRVTVDTRFIHDWPVIHIVDEAAQFCAASFLRNQSAKEIRNKIQHMWSLIYLGPPDYFVIDQGTAYKSKGMEEYLEALGACLDEAPIETPGETVTMERYHAPLRLVEERIPAVTRRQTSDNTWLDLAVFAINRTVGFEGLSPALLIFGAVPRPARLTRTSTQLERACLIDQVEGSREVTNTTKNLIFLEVYREQERNRTLSVSTRTFGWDTSTRVPFNKYYLKRTIQVYQNWWRNRFRSNELRTKHISLTIFEAKGLF